MKITTGRSLLTATISFASLVLAAQGLALLPMSPFVNTAWAQEVGAASRELSARGAYIARAADCAACHTAPHGGEPYAGGYGIQSPLGVIYTSNITPSKQYGIGAWTEQTFAHALRDGIGGHGQRLYPAMPYDAYHGMSDADVHALFVYLTQDVKPVDQAPKATTALSFPFNVRALMIGWDWLYVKQAKPAAAESADLQRGRYLVDVLGHCASCHSPRNVFMATTTAGYLSGANLSGWYAPNITSDPVSGIGSWSTEQLVAYLREGHVAGKAQAAGPMAEAVEHSFRYLDQSDLTAIAHYLKSVPAVRTPGQTQAADTYGGLDSATQHADRPYYDFDSLSARKTQDDAREGADAAASAVAAPDDMVGIGNGALLYENTCATCHQSSGSGTQDQYYPSLFHNTATGGATADNVVMTVLNGVRRHGADRDTSMPAFQNDLNDEQIAAITNYVMQRFGNPKAQTSAADVAVLRRGGPTPLIQRAMPWVYIGGLVFVALLLIAVILVARSRKRRSRKVG